MIRPARRRDLPRLRAIQMVALDEPWDGLLDPAIDGPPVVLVAVPDAQAGGTDPVGYAVAIPEGECAYLAEVAVAEPHRREGHGSELLAALCGRLSEAGQTTLRLTVRETDRGAREFYADHGFAVQSLLPGHYEDTDGLLLTRSLEDSTPG